MSPLDENVQQLAELKKRVQGQWSWLGDALSPVSGALRQLNATDEDNWLRAKVRWTRQSAEGALASVKSTASSAAERIAASTSSVTSHLDSAKVRALELRRQNPGLLVAGVTLASVAPAYRSGPRALFRNAVVGGGAAAFFLYPEFLAKTAPYVDRASLDVSKHAHKTAERLGLVKGGGEQ